MSLAMLRDLKPDFYRSAGNPAKGYLTFLCPVCEGEKSNRLRIPTHDKGPKTGIGGALRWHLTGTPPDWETVSLSPSIDLQMPCRWHGFITNGQAT